MTGVTGISSPPMLVLLDNDHHHDYCQDGDARQLQIQDDTVPEGLRDLLVAMLHPHPNKRLEVQSTSENHHQDGPSSSSSSHHRRPLVLEFVSLGASGLIWIWIRHFFLPSQDGFMMQETRP